jgi:hypothetical protein
MGRTRRKEIASKIRDGKVDVRNGRWWGRGKEKERRGNRRGERIKEEKVEEGR